MRARDKLNEAQFFLRQFSLAENERERRYYFSAFISAWRSVTFVLQKDYRSTHANIFDAWYTGKMEEIRRTEGAGTFLRLRTISQKEGNRFPRVTFEVQTPLGDVITVEVDPSKEPYASASISVQYVDGPIFSIDPDEPSQAQVVRHLPALLLSLSSLIKNATAWETLYCLEGDSTPMPLSKVVELCELNISAVAGVVAEAEARFGGRERQG